MNLRKCRTAAIIAILSGMIFVISTAQEETVCPEFTMSFSETFDDVAFRDPTSSVDHWGEGYVTLNKLGSNFAISQPEYIPNWINTVTSKDFDGDGWDDIIASSSSYSNVLAFVKNQGVEGQTGVFEITHWIDGSSGDAAGTPTLGVGGAPIDDSGHCGITSGDYDGDGDFDFLFIVSNGDSPYSLKRTWLYENRLADTGTMSFVQYDRSDLAADLGGMAWSATALVSIDYDGDGDIDILMGNRDGDVLLLRNGGNNRKFGHPGKFSVSTLVDTGWGERGASTLTVADFDGDGDLDILVGSVSYPDLKYYRNDGTGAFSLYTTYSPPMFDGAASVSISTDFDQDGDVDILIGTDNWNYSPGGEEIGGQAFYLRNSAGDFTIPWKFDERPGVFDFDLGVELDFDNDGDLDFLVADGNHSENFYLFINQIADVYNTHGVALSSNVSPSLDPRNHAVTKVRMTNLDQHILGGNAVGLAVEFYVSNNDGVNWEFYERFEGNDIHAYNLSLPEHTFHHYGAALRWKAVLTAEDDAIPDYPNASYESPWIGLVELEYTYVERREYSRTSVAASVVDESGQNKELIIAGTFYYPGWEGHIRAYDVTAMPTLNTSNTELSTVTRPDGSSATGRELVAEGVEIAWDAGELLNTRDPGSRAVYTALPDGAGGMDRVDFIPANEPLLRDPEGDSLLGDYNGDDLGLIDFVRGVGRDWRLGDINHSNPIVVGAPYGSSGLMGEGYSEFYNEWHDRPKVLYVGTNDGMLHCFDVLTGEEIWGYIPYNLIPKLKSMRGVDQITGDRFFVRDVFVDGSPVAADVVLGGNWRTILVCGQGPGKGSTIAGGTTGNFYFALDVTNPLDPRPLWEFTHDTMGETWSTPVIGKVERSGESWVMFCGSGYDNYAEGVIGHAVYAVDIESGEAFWVHTAGEIDTITQNGFSWNIQNTIPGSPSLADTNQNGTADTLYVGDLDGRIWKIDISIPFTGVDSWSAEVLYEDPSHFPIISKPAVWINPSAEPAITRLYFGTGGDDRAPNDVTYSFIGLMDSGAATQEERVEWFIGDPVALGLDASKQVAQFDPGEKVWADPQVGDYIVYFNTLTGSIESVDPCANIEGIGKLYGRFIIAKSGTVVGSSSFRTASGNVESLSLSIKTRSAVTLGEQTRTESGVRKREVYIQEFDSTIQKLEQLTGGLLKIKSWREIYRVIKPPF